VQGICAVGAASSRALRFALAGLALAGVLLVCATSATGKVFSSEHLGINFADSPANLGLASASGVGLARTEVLAGSDTDALMTLVASAHLRLYPVMGLPKSNGAAADARAMAQFVTSFAQRYGRGGWFWRAHPQLPYLPVLSYEIGNEPDVSPNSPSDEVSLHYWNPGDFALVYQTAKDALHAVQPDATAVVGGVLDSSEVSLSRAESYLTAIKSPDAVGYHPYLYFRDSMVADTLALRAWLNKHGDLGVPIDINEFGDFRGLQPDGAWNSTLVGYARWALCTQGLMVRSVQPFWWGGLSAADSDPWVPLTGSNLQPTSSGAAYLAFARNLTATGCPTMSSPKRTTASRPPPRRRRRTSHG
jgi:hypothetical protein